MLCPQPTRRGEPFLQTHWPQELSIAGPHPQCLLPLTVGKAHDLLVLLFTMCDDVAQVPVVQVATHIWWESSKHLLDLGKGQGVSLDQGQMGARAGGHPRKSECSWRQRGGGHRGQATGQGPTATPSFLFLSRESRETSSQHLKKSDLDGGDY